MTAVPATGRARRIAADAVVRCASAALGACAAAGAQAHAVHHRIEAAQAVVVTLTYANGQPFAYERYALTPAGQDVPRQVGQTDAAGRIALVPGTTTAWRLQASAADGHGVRLDFETPPPGAAAPAAGVAPAPDEALPRGLLAASGVAVIFGLFGVYQLFVRSGRS